MIERVVRIVLLSRPAGALDPQVLAVADRVVVVGGQTASRRFEAALGVTIASPSVENEN